MVLVIEEEPLVLQVLTTALRIGGFNVLTAQTDSMAEQLFHAHASTLCLVIVNISPEMWGVAFVQSLPNLTPRIPILFITGLGDVQIEHVLRANDPVLYKPFAMPHFLEAVATVIEGNTGASPRQ